MHFNLDVVWSRALVGFGSAQPRTRQVVAVAYTLGAVCMTATAFAWKDLSLFAVLTLPNPPPSFHSQSKSVWRAPREVVGEPAPLGLEGG